MLLYFNSQTEFPSQLPLPIQSVQKVDLAAEQLFNFVALEVADEMPVDIRWQLSVVMGYLFAFLNQLLHVVLAEVPTALPIHLHNLINCPSFTHNYQLGFHCVAATSSRHQLLDKPQILTFGQNAHAYYQLICNALPVYYCSGYQNTTTYLGTPQQIIDLNMKSYRQVIEDAIGRSMDKQNYNPNITLSKAQQQLRKVNFRLQSEKNDMVRQILQLKEANSKLHKKAQTQSRKRITAEKQLGELKGKLDRTQAVKNKMQQRLYSTQSLSTRRSVRSEREEPGGQSTTPLNVLSINRTSFPQKVTTTQSIQTTSPITHDMSVQVNLKQRSSNSKQIAKYKQKIKQLQQAVQIQKKVISELECQQHQSINTFRSNRQTGRITKSRRNIM